MLQMYTYVNMLEIPNQLSDTIHALRLLLTLVAYPCISFVLYKTRPSPLLIGSGCLSVAVVCALMGWSTFGDIRQNQSEADTRRNSSVDGKNQYHLLFFFFFFETQFFTGSAKTLSQTDYLRSVLVGNEV